MCVYLSACAQSSSISGFDPDVRMSVFVCLSLVEVARFALFWHRCFPALRYLCWCPLFAPLLASGTTYKGKRTVADSEDNLGPRWTFDVLELFPGHFQIVRILLALGALDQANHKNQATTWQVRKHIQTCSRDSKQARVEVTKGHARRARFNVF